MKAKPANICILHFGQLGDALLALPAIRAIRGEFADARLTLVAGKLAAGLVADLKMVDDVIAVDRVALLKGNKLSSIGKIIRLVADVRRRNFDLVIDLHSLYETNLLGYLSGAGLRLFAKREGRSINWLSNYRPAPPAENKTIHLAENYLAVLEPLGIDAADVSRALKFEPAPDANVERVLPPATDGKKLVGIIVGAGNHSRRWPLERFAALARELGAGGIVETAVFLGPEEESEADMVRNMFPAATRVVTGLRLVELAAAFARLDLLISNDTGPPHLAALVGTPIVIVIDERGPLRYLPFTDDMQVVRTGVISDIAVADVRAAVEAALSDKVA